MRNKTKEELQQEVDKLKARDHKMTQVLELAMTGRLVFLGVVPSRGDGITDELWHYYAVPNSDIYACIGYGKQGPFYAGMTESPVTSDEVWAVNLRDRAKMLRGGFNLQRNS